MNKRGIRVLTLNSELRLVKSKRSQITIFVIIAIIILALIVLYLIFRPSPGLTSSPDTPQGYMEACMKQETEKSLNKLTEQGGFTNPEFFKLYQSKKIAYLCFTNEYYKGCQMQVPFLKQHIQEQIKQEIQGEVISCLDSLKENLERKNNQVSLGKSEIKIEILPGKINTILNTDMTVTKESTQNYKEFESSLLSPIYNQIMIASSILNWEARYGDSDPLTYMLYFPDIKVEKMKLSDGSTIYTITDRNTESKFIFASRSFPWPSGYISQ